MQVGRPGSAERSGRLSVDTVRGTVGTHEDNDIARYRTNLFERATDHSDSFRDPIGVRADRKERCMRDDRTTQHEVP